MRPRGEMRQALARELRESPAWPAALAERVGAPVDAVRVVLDNMRRSGDAVVLREEPVPWSNRPVRVYGAPPIDDESRRPCGDSSICWDLIDCWSAWPAEA